MMTSLSLKGQNEALLKHYIEELKELKAVRVNPNLKRALSETVNRVKNLSGLIIIIVFLKDETIVYPEKIVPLLSNLNKYKLIFFKTEKCEEPNSNYFIF